MKEIGGVYSRWQSVASSRSLLLTNCNPIDVTVHECLREAASSLGLILDTETISLGFFEMGHQKDGVWWPCHIWDRGVTLVHKGDFRSKSAGSLCAGVISFLRDFRIKLISQCDLSPLRYYR